MIFGDSDYRLHKIIESPIMNYALPGPTKQQETRLAQAAQRGCERSKEELVRRFIPLIAKTASAFAINNHDPADIFAIATVGFMKGLNAFSPERGRLSTITVMAMRQEIRKVSNANRAGGGVACSQTWHPDDGVKPLSWQPLDGQVRDGSGSLKLIHEVIAAPEHEPEDPYDEPTWAQSLVEGDRHYLEDVMAGTPKSHCRGYRWAHVRNQRIREAFLAAG